MRRDDANKFAKEKLAESGLTGWHVRLSDNPKFVGLCDYKSKTILLNMHHVDIHPEAEIQNTILHEIAHALTPGHGHDQVWVDCARKIGCDNTSTSCSLSLPAHVIDAIRSGDVIELTTTEEIVRKVDYRITRLQDKCPTCGKVAVEKGRFEHGDKIFITLECMHLIVKTIPKGTAFDTIVFDGDPKCKHVWPPKLVNGLSIKGTICSKCNAKRPYDYQIEGMRFIEKFGGRGGLFDEMGLGKTLQALGYIKFHSESLPFVYVCKSGLKYTVMREIMRILPEVGVPYVFEKSNDYIFPGFKCYIISYDLLRRMSDEKLAQLKGIAKTIIIDECQHIKNPDSSRTQEVRRLCRDKEHVILMSGTHWKNRGSESYVALNLINPTKFGTFERFKKNWVQYIWDANTGKMKEGGLKKGFREHCKDIFIRRERTEVMKELPLINRQKLICKMPAEAMEAYDEAVDKFIKVWNQFTIDGKEDSFQAGGTIMQALVEMRQIVGMAKVPATVEYVEEFLENFESEKILVFVQHIAVGQLIYDQLKEYCDAEGINIVQLKGGASPIHRQQLEDSFNNNPKTRVAILSTLAAGEGLNLQTCSHGVMHERQWNPSNEEQPEGRMIRIGQKSQNVTMMYVHADGTCDVDLDSIVEGKRLRFHSTMNQTEMPVWDEKSITKEMGLATLARWKKRKKS